MNNKKGKDYFNSTAESFDKNYTDKNITARGFIERYLRIILPLAENKRTLEVGCGSGAFSSRISLLNKGKITVGIDYSENMLRIAKGNGQKSHLLLADALHLPFKDKAFDMIISIRTMQHIPDYHLVLNEMYRTLSDGGIAAFDVMNLLNPFAFIRTVICRPFEGVYLRALRRSQIYASCRNAKINIWHIYPLQFLLDPSNLNKYLPRFMAAFFIRVFASLDRVPEENSFLSNFALRLFVVAKKGS